MHLTPNAIAYTWRALAARAGLPHPGAEGTGFERAGVRAVYGPPAETRLDGPGVIVAPCCTDAPAVLLARAPGPLDWRPAAACAPPGAQLSLDSSLPFLFWGAGYEDGRAPFAERRADGAVVFYADIVAAAFFMLTRWEETVTPDRDEHGRFPASASVALRQAFLDRPLVDEYALILRAWLRTLLPGWEPTAPTFRVQLSHDIDTPLRWESWRTVTRTAGGDLLKRRARGRALETLRRGFRARRNHAHDEFFAGFRTLLALSERNHFTSVVNFMAAAPTAFDPGYDPRLPPYRNMIVETIDRGHEVGFHAGYDTFGDFARFTAELDRLAGVVGRRDLGGRQHFLRFSAPATWRAWEAAGLRYDFTAGYADHEGFRCGTCHPFAPYDIERDREMRFIERPLIVMDATLRGYRQLTPEAGEARILKLAARCRQVGGEFTLLWHNSSLDAAWGAWADVYARVVGALAAMRDGN